MSSSDCWAVGSESANVGAGFVVATINGGSTWSSETVPSGIGPLYAISCTAASDCEAVGADPTGGYAASISAATTVTMPAPTTSMLLPASGATLSGKETTHDATATNATSLVFWLFGGRTDTAAR